MNRNTTQNDRANSQQQQHDEDGAQAPLLSRNNPKFALLLERTRYLRDTCHAILSHTFSRPNITLEQRLDQLTTGLRNHVLLACGARLVGMLSEDELETLIIHVSRGDQRIEHIQDLIDSCTVAIKARQMGEPSTGSRH